MFPEVNDQREKLNEILHKSDSSVTEDENVANAENVANVEETTFLANTTPEAAESTSTPTTNEAT